MDQGIATVLAAAVALAAAIVGVILGGRISGQAAREAAQVSAEAARGAAAIAQKIAEDDRADARRERLRIRGEEAARLARKQLLAATDLFTFRAGAQRARQRANGGQAERWVSPIGKDTKALTSVASEAAIEIPDEQVRQFVQSASRVLFESHVLVQEGGPQPWEVSEMVKAATDGVIGAYLRGQPIPSTERIDELVATIEAHWADWDREIADTTEQTNRQERRNLTGSA